MYVRFYNDKYFVHILLNRTIKFIEKFIKFCVDLFIFEYEVTILVVEKINLEMYHHVRSPYSSDVVKSQCITTK
jgi:hypothetical protein